MKEAAHHGVLEAPVPGQGNPAVKLWPSSKPDTLQSESY